MNGLDPAEVAALAEEIRRIVAAEVRKTNTPRVTWGVVSAKVVGTPPTYTFTPEAAGSALPNKWPYLGANAPANGETVGGMWVGTDLFLLWRQTGTS